jgi:hypothetical protein
MKMTATKLTCVLLLFICFHSQAQLKPPVTNNDLRTNLQKIIADFPGNFSDLKGDTLVDNPQSIEFTSLLDFKMAMENSITLYKSVKPVYSWQALLLNTEQFDEAAQKYKWLYNQLKVMTINIDGYSFSLNGDYDAPDASRKFSSSVFRLTPNASNMPRLKIEASIQFEFPEWKVKLLVYEKEREDSERGEIHGE